MAIIVANDIHIPAEPIKTPNPMVAPCQGRAGSNTASLTTDEV